LSFLFGLRRFYGAGVPAGVAVDTFIFVDDVLSAFFGDALCGAYGFAGAAAETIIVDFVSHNKTSKK
jgi:hypothetical protein